MLNRSLGAAFVGLVMLLSTALASGQELYVRNKPYKGSVEVRNGGIRIRPEEIARALGLDVREVSGALEIDGKSLPYTEEPSGAQWISLEDLCSATGLKLVKNTELGTIDLFPPAMGAPKSVDTWDISSPQSVVSAYLAAELSARQTLAARIEAAGGPLPAREFLDLLQAAQKPFYTDAYMKENSFSDEEIEKAGGLAQLVQLGFLFPIQSAVGETKVTGTTAVVTATLESTEGDGKTRVWQDRFRLVYGASGWKISDRENGKSHARVKK